MSSNVYHKQPQPSRNRRDRVVVIDGPAKPGAPLNDPDGKANQNTQKTIRILILLVVFMGGFLFASIKILEVLWGRKDRSVRRITISQPVEAQPAVLSRPATAAPSAPATVAAEPIAPPTTATAPAADPLRRINRTNAETVDTIYRWGKVLEDAGEFDGALARYREALDVDPSNVTVLAQIGRLTIKLGQYGEAVRSLQKAIEGANSNPDIMNDLGVALTFDGQPREAVMLYDRLLKARPDYEAALFNKGYALVQLRDYTSARPLLEEYIKRKPDAAMAYGVLAVLELAEKNHDQALLLLDKSIALSPGWSMPYLDAAAICASIGRASQALDYLTRALDVTSPSDVYRHLQTEAFRDIRVSEAGIAFERILADRARERMQPASP
ncbi:MAG TPA: tetratricopeptide repeat protein [Kiritimatiellia bacterium]|nr:tetratricopeptide repeat protein [Kiritimatiellia bacterium]HMP32933.1 tetratricopeptide repeat protein [Kiritimatiellia bacterium]